MKTAPPSVLYHYTSLDVLTKVIYGRKLWASNYRYLNDASELVHFWQMIESRISLSETNASECALSRFAECKRWIREETSSTFVASFSAEQDNLSQWRGYCPQGLGVSVGFKSSAIIAALDQFIIPPGPNNFQPIRETGLTLSEVKYADLGCEELDVFVDHLRDAEDTKENKDLAESIWRGLSYLAPTYKNSKFCDEKEWRIVIPHRPESIRKRNVQFRVGRSTLIPYIEIALPCSTPYLAEVIVGSSPNIDLTVEAVTEMLRLNGMESVSVVASKVPYRHW